jgi:hypothetical protein
MGVDGTHARARAHTHTHTHGGACQPIIGHTSYKQHVRPAHGFEPVCSHIGKPALTCRAVVSVRTHDLGRCGVDEEAGKV